MDARTLKCEDGEMDCVIDKALVDAMMCGGDGSVDYVNRMLKEIHRVLNSTGVYISVSCALPDKRMDIFQKNIYEWQVFTEKVPKPSIKTALVVETGNDEEDAKNYHYVYIMAKNYVEPEEDEKPADDVEQSDEEDLSKE